MSINSLRRATLQGLLVLASQPLWPAISGSAEGGAAAANHDHIELFHGGICHGVFLLFN